jgi:protein-cysteine N-palmitoyltransferase HHAT
MYIPLGGSKRKLLNIWVIFTFVAVWHDLEWYILKHYYNKKVIVEIII